MKQTSKGIIILAILAILVAISGCLDNNYATEDDSNLLAGVNLPQEESNSTLVYGGHTHLTNGVGGYTLVIRMYDTAENNVCYVTYNGISCLKREVK